MAMEKKFRSMSIEMDVFDAAGQMESIRYWNNAWFAVLLLR